MQLIWSNLYIENQKHTSRERESGSDNSNTMVLAMILNWFLYPPPPSIFVTIMTVISTIGVAYFGLSEFRGVGLNYSKFGNTNSGKSRGAIHVPGKTGMLVLYNPALIAGLSSFVVYPDEGLRFFVLRLVLSIHFFKRVMEVLFIHKFSSVMTVETMSKISLSYFCSTAIMIYAQHLVQGYPTPEVNLMYPGIALFLIGISGNFYHHYLLSKLREKGDRGYKIPKGGLFDVIVCPHYLFEIIDYIGIAFISQTTYAFSFALGTVIYLMGRSYAYRRWYLSKFENFPKSLRALIPFVF